MRKGKSALLQKYIFMDNETSVLSSLIEESVPHIFTENK